MHYKTQLMLLKSRNVFKEAHSSGANSRRTLQNKSNQGLMRLWYLEQPHAGSVYNKIVVSSRGEF